MHHLWLPLERLGLRRLQGVLDVYGQTDVHTSINSRVGGIVPLDRRGEVMDDKIYWGMVEDRDMWKKRYTEAEHKRKLAEEKIAKFPTVFNNTITTDTDKINQLTGQLKATWNENTHLRKRIVEERGKVQEYQSLNSQLRETLTQLEGERDQALKDAAMYLERAQQSEGQEKRMEFEIKQFEARYKEEVAVVRELKQGWNGTLDNTTIGRILVDKEHAHKNLQDQFNQLVTQLAHSENHVVNLEAELKNLQSRYSVYGAENNTPLALAFAEKEKAYQNLHADYARATGERNQFFAEACKLPYWQTQFEKLETEVQLLKAQANTLTSQKDALGREVAALLRDGQVYAVRVLGARIRAILEDGTNTAGSVGNKQPTNQEPND